MGKKLATKSKSKAKSKPKSKPKSKAAATKPMAVKSAPKAVKSANGAPNKITLKHLAAGLAEEHQMTKKMGEAMLNDLVALITKHLKKGERIRISGLGILQVRKRAARMGRNPATGEAIKIKASKKVAFRAAKDLKMAV
jgi:DNA-binding protein HU-beta